ncbi:hypothetical protein L208DRAFT_1382350 [Tricholoma matsutake]|nr:hypothetical protein L208DRAFT_1382350 [Tricholoma matsutake 945]
MCASLQANDFAPFDVTSYDDLTLSDSDSEQPVDDNEATTNIFACTAHESLHGPSIDPSGPTSRGNWAWVVFNSRELSVFQTWDATAAQVNGYPNSLQHGFWTYDEAQSVWLHSCANATIGPPTSSPASVHVRVVPQAHSFTPPPSPTPAVPHSRVTNGSHLGASACVPQVGSATTSPLPQLHVPWSPSPGQVAPVASSHLRVFQPLPSVSTPPLCTTMLTWHCNAPHPMALSNEDAYWVVTRGECPGVHLGRAAASDALGPRGNWRVIKAGSRDQADQAFTKQYMHGDIDEIVDLDALDAFEALQLET